MATLMRHYPGINVARISRLQTHALLKNLPGNNPDSMLESMLRKTLVK